jgi:flagellar assembly protein FliH
MTDAAHQRFSFDLSFDGAEDVVSAARPRKALYSASEVDKIRAEAFEEGRHAALEDQEGERLVLTRDIGQSVRQAVEHLSQTAAGHRANLAELALVAARKIADAALDRFPEAPAKAAFDALLSEVEAEPRLMVRASEAAAERVETALAEAAETAGYSGLTVVRADPGLAGAAFVFEWGEGRAVFDPDESAARIAAALEAALAVGAHDEPPLTESETPNV